MFAYLAHVVQTVKSVCPRIWLFNLAFKLIDMLKYNNNLVKIQS